MAKAKKTTAPVEVELAPVGHDHVPLEEVTIATPEEFVEAENNVLKSMQGETVLSVTLTPTGNFLVVTREGQQYTLPPSEYEHYLKNDPLR